MQNQYLKKLKCDSKIKEHLVTKIMPQYELTLVTDARLDQPQTDQIIKNVEALVKKAQGQIIKTQNWGKKLLSYPIKKSYEGVFTHQVLEFVQNEAVKSFENQIRVHEEILRYLLIKKNSRVKTQLPKNKAKTTSGQAKSSKSDLQPSAPTAVTKSKSPKARK